MTNLHSLQHHDPTHRLSIRPSAWGHLSTLSPNCLSPYPPTIDIMVISIQTTPFCTLHIAERLLCDLYLPKAVTCSQHTEPVLYASSHTGHCGDHAESSEACALKRTYSLVWGEIKSPHQSREKPNNITKMRDLVSWKQTAGRFYTCLGRSRKSFPEEANIWAEGTVKEKTGKQRGFASATKTLAKQVNWKD